MSGSVSPPTRGWTRSGSGQERGADGFPAHAGMDLNASLVMSAQPRFPRPRGDGPVSLSDSPFASVVSPPTRGWTSAMGRRGRRRYGFPAHAGMDPSADQFLRSERWFPRPRGDGPVVRSVGSANSKVSPPTRGWTRMIDRWDWKPFGFPAHAGMDLGEGARHRCCRRFPRPRGDGPWKVDFPGSQQVVSPPTRGWTRPDRPAACRSRGFPAHAGMDLDDDDGNPLLVGFPRPRGDGPQHLASRLRKCQVSPPTRGWTQLALVFHDAWIGFPAHAGMDP